MRFSGGAVGHGCWTPCTPSLEDLGQANVDVQLGIGCLRLLGRDRGFMTGSEEEDQDHHLFGVLLDFLNVTDEFPPRKSQTEDYCLVSGPWCTKVSLPMTISQTRSHLPPSSVSKHAKAPLQTTPPLFLSKLGGASNGRNASRQPGDDGGSDLNFPM